MNILYSVLLCLALGAMQWLIGGTRLLFSLPSYGVLALLGVLSVISLRDRKILPNRACLLATAICFSYVLARALTSPVIYLSWPDLFMVQGALIIYLTTACYLTDAGRRLWILGWLLFLAVLNVGVGARQFVVGDSYMLSGLGRSTQYLGRASGLYICPDHLAGFLEIVSLMTLSAIVWSRCRLWIKLLMGYGVLCCFAGMILTGSRGGFLSILVGLTLLVLLSLARIRSIVPQVFPRAILIVAIVGLIGAVGLDLAVSKSNALKYRASHLIEHDVRFMLWPSAIKEWQLSPVFGTGSATFLYYGRRFRDPRLMADPVNTHNDYLQFLGEYGALGMVGMLLFLAAHLRWGWVAYRHLSLRSAEERTRRGAASSNAAAWNIGALSAVAAIAAHSIVDFNLHIPINSLVMAFVFGVLANPGRDVSGTPDEPVSRAKWIDHLPRLAIPALSIWLAVAGLPHLPGEYYAEEARKALRDNHNLLGLNSALEGLKHESLNPMLFYYAGESRQVLADSISNEAVSQSFLEASVEPYREGVKLFPEDTRLLLRLGSALTRLGRFDEAAPVLQRALEWDPYFPLTHTYYGLYLARQGRLPEANAAFHEATKLSPDPTALKSLEQIAAMAPGALNN